jgi:hypothetical protein
LVRRLFAHKFESKIVLYVHCMYASKEQPESTPDRHAHVCWQQQLPPRLLLYYGEEEL